MAVYCFTIYGDRAPEPVIVSLPNDDAAWDCGENIVRRLLKIKDTLKRETWTMTIMEGSRQVASIGFDVKSLRERRSEQ